MIQRPSRFFCWLCGGLIWLAMVSPTMAGWTQLPTVIHVQTDFGSGDYSVKELATRARNAGIEVLIPTDHDLVVMEYGLWPLRNLLKRRVSRPSILAMGPESYLAAISDVNRQQGDVLVIPGAQSSPFYYWTGSPWSGTLTAHDYRKEVLILGMTEPDAYRGLPLLHRGLSTQHVRVLLPAFLVWVAVAAIGAAVWTTANRRRWRMIGRIVVAVGVLLMINHHPFQSSRFDPYHGDAGIGPFQDLIDYTASHGGLVYWAHPESNFAARGSKIDTVHFKTSFYPDALLASDRYAGFSAIYGDTVRATAPGRHWDKVLLDYCNGRRRSPGWGIAGADYHRDFHWVRIDSFQTIVLTREKTEAAVLSALAAGRNYSIQKHRGKALSLEVFQVEREAQPDRFAILGETLNAGERVRVRARVAYRQGGQGPVTVRLIRDGVVIAESRGPAPQQIEHVVTIHPGSPMTYVRLLAEDDFDGRLVSNPIFVRPQVSSASFADG